MILANLTEVASQHGAAVLEFLDAAYVWDNFSLPLPHPSPPPPYGNVAFNIGRFVPQMIPGSCDSAFKKTFADDYCAAVEANSTIHNCSGKWVL